jgi:hypothetical protein
MTARDRQHSRATIFLVFSLWSKEREPVFRGFAGDVKMASTDKKEEFRGCVGIQILLVKQRDPLSMRIRPLGKWILGGGQPVSFLVSCIYID